MEEDPTDGVEEGCDDGTYEGVVMVIYLIDPNGRRVEEEEKIDLRGEGGTTSFQEEVVYPLGGVEEGEA